MNAYQKFILDYFDEKKEEFLIWMISSPSESKVIIIDNLAKKTIEFLKEEISKDIKTINKQSKKYNMLIDAFIELHITKKNGMFFDILQRKCFFIFSSYEPSCEIF